MIQLSCRTILNSQTDDQAWTKVNRDISHCKKHAKEYQLGIPARELTFPTRGKGKSSTQNLLCLGDMLVPRRIPWFSITVISNQKQYCIHTFFLALCIDVFYQSENSLPFMMPTFCHTRAKLPGRNLSSPPVSWKQIWIPSLHLQGDDTWDSTLIDVIKGTKNLGWFKMLIEHTDFNMRH